MALSGRALPISVAGITILIISCIIQIASVVTPFWNYFRYKDIKIYGGLWTNCITTIHTTQCSTVDCELKQIKDTDYCSVIWRLIQIFECVGVAALGGAIILIILYFVLEYRPHLKGVAIGCCFVAGAVILSGSVLYATRVEKSSLHFSFIYSLIAATGSAVSGIFLLVGN